MNEDFLHYVWKFQKISTQNLLSVNEEEIRIFTTGMHNYNSGPDFFNAKVSIEGQIWVGNVELHLKSSDWYAHKHELDTEYNNVILHVVWKHDHEILRKDLTIIPTLELKEYVNRSLLRNYQNLFLKGKKLINCEDELPFIEPIIIKNWMDRLYVERLEMKCRDHSHELINSQYDWERILFHLLCKNFGLKLNGDSFESVARSVDYMVIKKCSQDLLKLEALLFGQSGLLEDVHDDPYFNLLKSTYQFLKNKFELNNIGVVKPKFFRLRPASFPTIRLSQLAVLFSSETNLFSKVIESRSLNEYYELFNISSSDYWETHYQFNVDSASRTKRVTKNFIDLLIINTIIPIKYSYVSYIGKENSGELIEMVSSLKCEENQIIRKFNQINKLAINGLHSQALLHLKKNYCDKNLCLQCSIGNYLLKK